MRDITSMPGYHLKACCSRCHGTKRLVSYPSRPDTVCQKCLDKEKASHDMSAPATRADIEEVLDLIREMAARIS